LQVAEARTLKWEKKGVVGWFIITDSLSNEEFLMEKNYTISLIRVLCIALAYSRARKELK